MKASKTPDHGQIQDFSEGNQAQTRGCQPIMWPKFPENCMKTKKIEPSRGRPKFYYIDRVATAQGKQGIWFLLFPDRENTGNFILGRMWPPCIDPPL